MRIMRWLAGIIGAWSVTIIVLSTAPYAQEPAPIGAGDFRPPPPPVQPIAYSHTTHAAAGLQCAVCHTTATTEDHATLPPTATCMGCHATTRPDSPDVQKLAAYAARGELVPWRRVYRVPDYVYFSHATHMGSDRKLTCASCHGDVAEMTVMQKVRDISMAACIECHKTNTAPTECDSCHERR